MAMTISGKDYIAWVQRALNRLVGSSLVTNGDDTPDYREAVRAFRSKYKLGSATTFGKSEETTLIKANHATPDYVTWAHTVLEKVGLPAAGGPTSKIIDRTALVSFQDFAPEGLNGDGWLGPNTELLLIQRTGMFPPGHATRPTPVKPVEPTEEIKTSVEVGYPVRRLLQRGPTCWAAAFAMMYGWKRRSPFSIQATLDVAGEVWTKQFNSSLPLSEGQTAKLGGILGLTGKKDVPDNWVTTLRDHGPVMLVQNPGEENWLHWVVVVAYHKTLVFPDRTQDREELGYHEPGNASSRSADLSSVVDSANSLSVSHYRCYRF